MFSSGEFSNKIPVISPHQYVTQHIPFVLIQDVGNWSNTLPLLEILQNMDCLIWVSTRGLLFQFFISPQRKERGERWSTVFNPAHLCHFTMLVQLHHSARASVEIQMPSPMHIFLKVYIPFCRVTSAVSTMYRYICFAYSALLIKLYFSLFIKVYLRIQRSNF